MEYQNKPEQGGSDRATDKATDSAGETRADGNSARAGAFVDARPVMARDRQLMQMMRANADTHVDARKQAAAPPAAAKPVLQPKQMSRLPSSRSPIQLATTVKGEEVGGVASEATHTEGYFAIDPVRHPGVYAEVGTKMTATLYEKSPLKGSPVGNQWLWMDALKNRANTTVIRGHLLNHDLGGRGLPHNLFPISNAANQEHSNQVEQKVKGLLYGPNKLNTDQKPLTYEVEVTNRDDVALTATFHCTWTHPDSKGTYDVRSDLGKKTKFSMAGPTDAAGRPIAKIVPAAAWAKGDKEVIPKQDDRYVQWIGQNPAFSHGGVFDINTGQTRARIAGVEEGSQYQAIPYWKRQINNMESSGLYLHAVQEWWDKKNAKGRQQAELNDALDFAVDQIVPVTRQAPKGAGGSGRLWVKKIKGKKITAPQRASARIVLRPSVQLPSAFEKGRAFEKGKAKFVANQARRRRRDQLDAAGNVRLPEQDEKPDFSSREEIMRLKKLQESTYESDIEESIRTMLRNANEALENKG